MGGRDKDMSGDGGKAGGDAVQVLIVDDSVVVRRIMAKVLGEDARFAVAAAVASGEEAVAFVHANRVDLILLDMALPGEDGLSVLGKIMAHDRHIQVVLLSASLREGSEVALRALGMGASDVIAKPAAGHFSPSFIEHLRDRLSHLTPAAERARTPAQLDQSTARLRPLGTTVRAVAIGGSTGGIGSVTTVMAGFKAHIPVPLFVTQHLPANFQPLFAEQLRRATHLPVVVARMAWMCIPARSTSRPATPISASIAARPGTLRSAIARKPACTAAIRRSIRCSAPSPMSMAPAPAA